MNARTNVTISQRNDGDLSAPGMTAATCATEHRRRVEGRG
jgi:hypothetical protein